MSAIAKIDFDEMIMNIKKGIYKQIGFGSGRLVFDVGGGYVAKVAKNKRGIAQNEAEYYISSVDRSNLFAKIREVSDDSGILIMEKAERISNFSDIRNFFMARNNRELFQKKEIQEVIKEHQLIPQDLYNLDSWGMVNGRPVIIDYGFTWSVKRRYYFPF